MNLISIKKKNFKNLIVKPLKVSEKQYKLELNMYDLESNKPGFKSGLHSVELGHWTELLSLSFSSSKVPTSQWDCEGEVQACV